MIDVIRSRPGLPQALEIDTYRAFSGLFKCFPGMRPEHYEAASQYARKNVECGATPYHMTPVETAFYDTYRSVYAKYRAMKKSHMNKFRIIGIMHGVIAKFFGGNNLFGGPGFLSLGTHGMMGLQMMGAASSGGGKASGYTAKSVILDVSENIGTTQFINLRSVDLYLSGELIETSDSTITCYATNYRSSGEHPKYAFLTSTSKIGDSWEAAWRADYTQNGYSWNFRLICVFSSSLSFDNIVINNGHRSGLYTGEGVESAKIYISTDAITDTTYGAAISNSTKIFDGQFAQHVAQDIADPQTLTLIAA